MRMRRPGVALELLDHRVAERAFGQHALDGFFERTAGKARLHLAERRRADAARIAAVPMVELVLGLVAGDADLLDVRDDDEISGVHVRRVDRLVLAAQPRCDLGREPAEHLVGGVDDVPGVRDVAGPGGEGFHCGNPGFRAGRTGALPALGKDRDCTISGDGRSTRDRLRAPAPWGRGRATAWCGAMHARRTKKWRGPFET